jgi:hypothetical protein
MPFVVGLILVVLGLLSVFAKDIVWEFTEWSNQARGLVSERTDWWDTTTTIGGVFAIIVGIAAMFINFM